jgi:HD-like signal output (HDOD) protein
MSIGAGADLRLTEPMPGAIAAPDQPMDRALWMNKLKALGRVEKERTLESISTLSLPCLFPSIRKNVRQSLSTLQATPEYTHELLFEEPALGPAVLGMANNKSPRETILDLQEAIRRVGQRGIEDVIDLVEMDAPPVSALARPWMVNWWCHAMAVSQFAGVLSIAQGVDPAAARVAGLIHDLGRFVLLSSRFANKLVSLYEVSHRLTFATTMAETSLLGLDHRQAGAMYCSRLGLPAYVRQVCETHDLDDAMRDQLPESDQKITAVVTAANELAKAVGIGSLPGDEINPLPACMVQAATELSVSLESALAEIQTLCYWRVGHSGVAPLPELAQLRGRLVVLVTSSAGPWNPIRRLLVRAGARVSWFTDVKEVIEARPMSDVMLLDYCDASLHLTMPAICRLGAMDCFRDVPKMLLARRTEDPQGRVDQANLDIRVFPTPVRSLALLQAIRELTD